MEIAFFGLGNMGAPMAENLIKAGHQVRGFDIASASSLKFEQAGGHVTPTPEEAVKGADVVISMLPNGQTVRDLYMGKHNIFSMLLPQTLVIDSSTIDLTTARDIAQQAYAQGLEFLDAPVSGGTAGAASGTLTFMVGGEQAVFDRASPLLSAMGKNIFHAGAAGNGQLVKMCNNMLLAIHMAGTAEALALGEANGLDPNVLSNIMLQSSGSNWSLEKYNPVPGVLDNVPASRGYHGGFMVNLMLKDLGLVAEIAEQSEQSIPMGDQARDLFQKHGNKGHGELDFSSIYQTYHDN